ncbi:hypothetical protein CLCR_00529 [Cladophialophora carrionii]|uniref:RNA helicase n=1 Tax=Cladophialophora carrionii TaxID=86049 RepID=A0A1C1CC44_9EURO|nr:hypothetical protein CLCR_00529 [Cladophialophora carrionii]
MIKDRADSNTMRRTYEEDENKPGRLRLRDQNATDNPTYPSRGHPAVDWIWTQDQPEDRLAPVMLYIAPTRALVNQNLMEFKFFTLGTNLTCRNITGGHNYLLQVKEAKKACDILCITSGALFKLHNEGFMTLNRLEYLVFDEAHSLFRPATET